MNKFIGIVQYNLAHHIDHAKGSFAKLIKVENDYNLTRIRLRNGELQVNRNAFGNVEDFTLLEEASEFSLEFSYE